MERVLVKHRDSTSVEIKARYIMPQAPQWRTRYRLELFFFFPTAFDVSEHTVDPEEFYDQIQTHLRFNTPSFSPPELLRHDSETSPLRRVERLVSQGSLTNELRGSLEYESQLLASVLKSILRDAVLSLRPERDQVATESVDDAAETITACAEVATQFHTLVQGLDADETIKRHLTLVDEGISLVLERYVAALLSFAPELPDSVVKRQSDLLARELRYRRNRGYPTVAHRDSSTPELEEYVYREKMLKDYAAEALQCNVTRRNSGQAVQHVLYALAAGLAMVVATGIAFYGQTRFEGLTLSLFVLLVAGYMVKDRVKDLFRDLFLRRIGRRFSDRSSTVRDPRRRHRIAVLKERAAFAYESKLQPRIRALRGRGYFESTIHRFEQENILRYVHESRVNTRTLGRIHTRFRGLADVTTVNLDPFLLRLRTRQGLVPYVNTNGDVVSQRVEQTYHLSVVVRFTDQVGDYARRLRLVVDSSGIRRIEEPAGHTDADAEAIRFVGRGASTGDPDLDDPDRDRHSNP